MQRNNLIYISFMILCLLSCDSQRQILDRENKAPSNKSLKLYSIDDSGSSTRSLFEQISLEAPDDVYYFINAELNRDALSEICKNSKNKVVVINITVLDSIIIHCDANVYEYNSIGNLIKYTDGADEITDHFISKDALMFSFIDSYKISYYNFRLEMSRLCE